MTAQIIQFKPRALPFKRWRDRRTFTENGIKYPGNGHIDLDDEVWVLTMDGCDFTVPKNDLKTLGALEEMLHEHLTQTGAL